LLQKDATAWQKAIDRAIYAPDWLIEQYQKELDLNSAQGKRAFTDVLLTTVRRLRDPIEQEHYLKKIAELTQTSLNAVQAKLSNSTAAPEQRIKKIKAQSKLQDRSTIEYQKLQDHFLAMAMMQPKLRGLLKDCHPEYFTDGPPRIVFKFLLKHPDFKGNTKLAEQLHEVGDYVKIITLQFEEVYSGLPLEDLLEQAEKLKHRLIDRYVKTQNQKIVQAIDTAETEEQKQELMAKADKLNQLIK
jgi:DNA primase